MAFLPIFLIGLLLGIGLRWVYDEFRKNAPTETKLHLQEITIKNLRRDNQLMSEHISTLQTELDELKNKK